VDELSSNRDDKRTLEELRAAFTSNVVRLLLATPVLRILSSLQRTLDSLDIEGLSKLWQLSQSTSAILHSPIGSNIPEPTLQNWIAFVDAYLCSITCPPSPDPTNLMYYLYAYLLSASFKDCSIILRLPLDLPSCSIPELKPGAVTVIDLDPKSMNRLRKWEKLDTEVVGSYRLVRKDERRMCVDSQVNYANT
jgi:inositol-pentakisphosphate 2-kinase